MNQNRTKRFTLMLMLAALLLPYPGPAVYAQEAARNAFDKWRPKAGVYAEPGKTFRASCDAGGGLTINLREKSVSGYEWGCDVQRITDLGPGSLKVEMVCNDYNLAQDREPRDPDWETRTFNEVMFVRRIDDATITVQKSLNGKLSGPPGREAYCPRQTQRGLVEVGLRAKTEANAHPREGVYAAAGPDFDARCAKFDDTIVAVSLKSITTASNMCKINNTRVQLPDTVRIRADCTPLPTYADAVRVQDWVTTPDGENLMFKKIDDKTVILWIIKDGHFTGDGRKLSYCSDQVQRAYAAQNRTGKQSKN